MPGRRLSCQQGRNDISIGNMTNEQLLIMTEKVTGTLRPLKINKTDSVQGCGVKCMVHKWGGDLILDRQHNIKSHPAVPACNPGAGKGTAGSLGLAGQLVYLNLQAPSSLRNSVSKKPRCLPPSLMSQVLISCTRVVEGKN